jgi:tight adherence protein B
VIAGALAGGALAAWAVLGVATRQRVRATRRRLRRCTVPGPAGSEHAAHVGAEPVGRARRPGRFDPERQRSNRLDVRARLSRRRQPRGAVGESDVVLAESCDAIARALRGGRSLSAAVVESAERQGHPALVEISHAVTVGEQLPRAIDRAAARSPDPDVTLVIQVLAVAAEHGGSQAEAIDRAAATLRERAALRAERQAQAASARLSTRVMTVLPFAFTGVVAASDADVRDVLVRTPVGWTCLTLGIALNVAGRAWAKRAVAA